MKVLHACQAIPGHIHPNIALALTLRARGHEMAFYSGRRAQEKIERQGFRYYPFQEEMDRILTSVIFPAPGELTASNLADEALKLSDRGRVERILKQWFLQTIPQQLEDLEKIIEDFDPDVLVCDFTLMGPILILQHRCKVPVAVFCVIPASPIPGPDVPPWGPGLPRPTSWVGRLQHRLRQKLMEVFLSGYKAEADRIRKQYGLPKLSGRVADEYGRVPLFMVAGTPSLDYNRSDLPPTVQYVGLCEADNGIAAPVPEWLASLRPGSPVVHVTEGTVHFKDPVVLKAAVEGLKDADIRVVITTGTDRNADELGLGSVADNIRIEAFVPHEPLFERCDLLVTTGSAGTVSKALAAGVPIVIVPIGWEHAENAQRIVDSGVGVRLEPRNCNAKSLREAVDHVLSHPNYRSRALALGKELLAQGGSRRGAELLEQLTGRAQGCQT